MKNCIKCNAEINDDERFCHVCGAEQTVSQPEVQNETADTQDAPFAGADAASFAGAGDNQPSQQKNVYFTPGTDVQPAAFNGGAVVENVAAPKKKKGRKVLAVIIAVIILFVAGFVIKSVMTGVLSGDSKFEMGVVNENSYTNSSVDLKINCPDGWEVLSGDYLSDFLEINPDAEGKYVDYDGTVYEFAAMNLESGSNVLVSNFEGNIADAVLDDDEAFETIIESYKEDGNIVGEPYEMTIGGETYNCFDAEGESMGETFNQRILVVKEGMQYFYIVITVFPEYDDVTAQELIDTYFTSAK